MARVCYCFHCKDGIDDPSLINLEGSNGVADLHFVSKLDPRWTSFEWTSLWFMSNSMHSLVERVLARKKQEFGEPPIDLDIHECGHHQ